jgi:hypothetical protein
MTLEETATITDFHLPNKVRGLGISRVYTCGPDTNNETALHVERTGMESNPLKCTYDKSNFKNTAKELESVLITSGLDHKTTQKFIALLTKICIKMEQRRQKTQRSSNSKYARYCDLYTSIGCSRKAIICIQIYGRDNKGIRFYLCKRCASFFEYQLKYNSNKKMSERTVQPECSNASSHCNSMGCY